MTAHPEHSILYKEDGLVSEEYMTFDTHELFVFVVF